MMWEKVTSYLQFAGALLAIPAAAAATAGITASVTPPAARSPANGFGLSPAGEQRGWVALMRREPGKPPESHFDGYAVTDAALPGVGTVLTARRLLAVWLEPL